MRHVDWQTPHLIGALFYRLFRGLAVLHLTRMGFTGLMCQYAKKNPATHVVKE